MSFSPVIHIYTTPRYLTVNVFLVETEKGVVVIDGATAVSTSHEIREIIDRQIKKPILAVLLTHGHPDHYVGVGEILKGDDVPIYATQGTLDFAQYQDREKFDTLIRNNYGEDIPQLRVFPNNLVTDGQELELDGVNFQIKDLGPCESGGDTLWILTVEGVKHVFVGDIIYGHTHSYFRDGYVMDWLDALDKMLQWFDHTTVIHPSHGETCGIEMVYWQKAYIQAFIGILKPMLNGRNFLEADEKEKLIGKMKSFLPNEKLIFLMKYELDETIKLLKEKNVV